MLADPRTKARLADLGAEVLSLSPADFGKLLAEEAEKWAKVIKVCGDQSGRNSIASSCLRCADGGRSG
jgi:hypothetical protein